MSGTVPVTASQLLPRDLQERFKTGEVLELEFKLIHGTGKWDPEDRAEDKERAEFIGKASAHMRDDPAEAERLALHAWSVRNLPGDGQAALCLSGGGIRSAAFALGILQGLARRNLLQQFHYLSTVSGGGYIASWLTAWRHRSKGNEVLDRLQPRKFGEFTEPAPMRRLRFNQNFLTPKVGLVSADTWTAVAAVLRNLFLNWLVFLPLVAGLLLMPRIVEAFIVWIGQNNPHSSLVALFTDFFWLPHNDGEPLSHKVDLGGWSGWRSWVDSAAVLLILLGFSISAYNRPARGLTSMTQSDFVRRVVCPVSLGAVLLSAAVGSWVGQMTGQWAELLRWVFFGAIVYVVARLIAAIWALPRRAKVPARYKLVFPLELIGWAFAGMCTGLLVGIGAQFCRALGWSPVTNPEHAKYLATFGPAWIVLCFLVGEAIYVGVTSRLPYGERDREWLARAGGWYGIFLAAYLVFSWIVLLAWQEIHEAYYLALAIIGSSGLFSILGALTPFTRATAASASKEKLPLTGIVAVLSGLFVMGASAALARATLEFLRPLAELVHDALDFPLISGSPDRTFPPGAELAFIASTCIALLCISAAVSVFVNVNLFSLHAMYRNRLVRTFLGASNVRRNRKKEARDSFDGFSEQDNLAMAELYEHMEVGEVTLYPVLNVSLNMLATQNLAWQERKAEPFVCTPFFTGGDRVGYRPSALYGAGWWGSASTPERGITLGTAMAVSGAAVSPNWGYHSSPITSFLMMLFNVRLGWWLGNPKHKATWRYRGPRLSWQLFLQEALGWTDENEPWIYLSDGGHFENLGLYEMVRRRCRMIVVSDAGADPNCTLEDLGNAVRKIAIDLGVKIEFRRIRVRKRSDMAVAGVYCAEGKIHYPEGGDGHIIYFKPGFYGLEEPADVRAYAAANAKFPHEGTLNQWFGESQFESYRSLGSYVIDEICKETNADLDLTKFAALVHDHLDEFEKQLTNGATVVDIRHPIQVTRAA